MIERSMAAVRDQTHTHARAHTFKILTLLGYLSILETYTNMTQLLCFCILCAMTGGSLGLNANLRLYLSLLLDEACQDWKKNKGLC